MQNQPLYVSIGEAVRISTLSERSIYYLMSSGELTSKKVGRRRLVSYDSLRSLGEPSAEQAA